MLSGRHTPPTREGGRLSSCWGSDNQYPINTHETSTLSDDSTTDRDNIRPVSTIRRWPEISALALSSLIVLAFWGSRAEGQVPLVQGFLSDYVVEQAASIGSAVHHSNVELAALNSINDTQYGHGGSTAQNQASSGAQTVLDSYLIAPAPIEGDYITELQEERSSVVEYVVQEGDSIGFIASDYGVSVASIIWANELADADSISPGQVLKIPPVSGVLHTVKSGDTVSSIASVYDAEVDDIIAYNALPKSGELSINRVLVIPNGTVPSRVTTTTTVATTTRSFGYLPNLDGYFMQPTTGMNWGRIHGRNGVDIANPLCGQVPIYASADGVVTFASGVGAYNGGFGNYVKISHPNGTETLYAHASKVLVGSGQAVAQGQQIATMGTTGRSTGCHLHFEVHGARNPLAKY